MSKTQVGPDRFGRSILQTITDSSAVYQVYTDFTNTVVAFTVALPNTNVQSALVSINGMAPADYVEPEPPIQATVLNNLLSEAPAPARTLNQAFMPNAFYATHVYYTAQISCTASLSGGQSGKIELVCDGSPNPNTQRCFIYNSNSAAPVMNNTTSSVLSYLVPAGYYVKLVTTGDAAFTLAAQSEVVVAQ